MALPNGGGNGPEKAISELERKHPCCIPSDLDRKAIIRLNKYDGKNREQLRISRITALLSLRSKVLEKSGRATKYMEFLFSVVGEFGGVKYAVPSLFPIRTQSRVASSSKLAAS